MKPLAPEVQRSNPTRDLWDTPGISAAPAAGRPPHTGDPALDAAAWSRWLGPGPGEWIGPMRRPSRKCKSTDVTSRDLSPAPTSEKRDRDYRSSRPTIDSPVADSDSEKTVPLSPSDEDIPTRQAAAPLAITSSMESTSLKCWTCGDEPCWLCHHFTDDIPTNVCSILTPGIPKTDLMLAHMERFENVDRDLEADPYILKNTELTAYLALSSDLLLR